MMNSRSLFSGVGNPPQTEFKAMSCVNPCALNFAYLRDVLDHPGT